MRGVVPQGSPPRTMTGFLSGYVPSRHLGLTPAMPLIDARRAGTLLGVPASWVLAQARRERIPHVRLGRYVRFDPLELEAWWRARLRGGHGTPTTPRAAVQLPAVGPLARERTASRPPTAVIRAVVPQSVPKRANLT